MEPLSLFAILLWIILLWKVIAHGIKVVDVLLYIILWFLAAKFEVIDSNDEIVHFLSEIWVIFLMFYAGWHEDSKTFIKKVIKNKWIAIIWAIGPFVWAYFWTKILWFTFNESVVAGFIFTATAVPYTIAILQSLKLDKTPAAKSIVAAAMADDFISIVAVSAVFSTFALLQTGNWNMSTIILATWIKLLLLLVCFFVFFLLATVIFPETKKDYKNYKWTRKLFIFLTNLFWLKWFTKKFHKVEILVPTVLFLMIFLSLFSHFMWLHAAIWAYLTGLILNRDMFHRGSDKNSESSDLTLVIYSISNHFLWPIFFIYLGTQLIIDFNNFSQVFIYWVVLFLFISILQFITSYYASRYTANLSHRDSVLVWFGMWPRDVLAFVILWIAITYWLIDKESIFWTVIVVTILLLDITAPIFMKWWSSRYEEEETLDKK
jgi:Kef-type K+ transport system membrane component KefB